MARSLRGSLRWRLMASVAAVLIVAFAATYIAVYSGTGAQLRGQIDRELRGDAAALQRALAAPAAGGGSRALVAAARRDVAAQPFRATSRLLVVTIAGSAPLTNEPELLGLTAAESDESGSHQLDENRLAAALVAARPGFATVRAPDVGSLRLLTATVAVGGRRVARIAVGEPLETVHRAEEGLRRTFLLAGGIALAVALLAVNLIADRLSRPLRRMAQVAAGAAAGDLSQRIGGAGRADEVQVLADAFDHMLDRLDDAFSRQRAFVADASHELRTPLTAIRGQLEVLARQRAPSAEEVRRVQRLVGAELERMTRLVDDLLLLAHSDETRFVARKPIDLGSFVPELLELTRHTAARRFELDPGARGTLDADPDRLAQALRNLLRNAIEHTAEGGLVRLSVAAHGERVRFTVEDDGPGIAPEQRGLIFDRFHRTDAARTRAGGGTGLGLAIVHAIAEAHGGRVWAGESSAGGARIDLELPGYRAG